MSLSPPLPTPRPGECGMVAGLVPAEPAPAARAQVCGGGPAAAGAVPARAAGLPASLLGPGCPCHLAHQHHPRSRPFLQVGASPCPALTSSVPSLSGFSRGLCAPVTPNQASLPAPRAPAPRGRSQSCPLPQWAPPSALSFLEDDSLYLLKESEAKVKLD